MIQFLLLLLPIAFFKFPCESEDNLETDSDFSSSDGLVGSDVSTGSSSCFTAYGLSLVESSEDGTSHLELCGLLGPVVPQDDASPNFTNTKNELPTNLNDSIVMDLPVGYRRLRSAMLNSKSDFWTNVILKNALKYDDITSTKWSQHDDYIGQPISTDNETKCDIQGAKRTITYVMPAGKLVRANTAIETATITDYNDNFFAILMSTSTPGVPFGKHFLALTQIVVVNMGNSKCQMICSVQPEFPHGPPLGLKGQITKGMRTGTIATFKTIGAHIKSCAISYGWC